jgi:hypothetical protein
MNRTIGTFVAFLGAVVACATNGDEHPDLQPTPPPALAVDGGGGISPACAGKPTTCSQDLHHVIDCTGRVLETCSPDTACGAIGTCVHACQGAAEAFGSVGCEFFAHVPSAKVETQIYGPLGAAGACFAAFVTNTWGSDVKLHVEYDGQTLPTSPFVALVSASTATVPGGDAGGADSGDDGGANDAGAGGGLPSLAYAPIVDDVVPSGSTVVLFLAGSTASPFPCPAGFTPPLTDPAAWATGSGRAKAFSIQTSAPVGATSIFPYGGASSMFTGSTLLLPSDAWGRSYYAVSGGAFNPGYDIASSKWPWISIVAKEDDTKVTLTPNVDIHAAPGVEAAPRGVPHTYSLQRGEVLRLSQPDDLTGTPITSTKLVALFAGHECVNPARSYGSMVFDCDADHDQIAPLSAWGNRYAAVGHSNRSKGHAETRYWRIVGAADGTDLTYEPAFPPSAPRTLAAGQAVLFETTFDTESFIVRSQDDKHPFFLASYMSDSHELSATGTGGWLGDPEFVPIVPMAQYLGQYGVFTDPTYPETELVVVQSKTGGAFADITLDCIDGGKITDFSPLTDDVRYARVRLVTGNYQPVQGCHNGQHVLTSTVPFGVTVWAWGSAATGGGSLGSGRGPGCPFCPDTPPGQWTQDVSYGYPGGASVRPLTDVTVQGTH